MTKLARSGPTSDNIVVVLGIFVKYDELAIRLCSLHGVGTSTYILAVPLSVLLFVTYARLNQ